MELNGTAFSFEVPEAWEVIPAEGMVMASASPGYLGFRPTIVLHESRIDAPALTTPASVSQLALRTIPQEVPSAYVVSMEAVPDGSAGPDTRERWRIWTLAPVKPPMNELLGLVLIQDFMVAGNAIAELTLTLPALTWQSDGSLEQILNSLRPLGYGMLSQLTAQVPEAALDRWATTRDDAPREDVTVQGYLPPILLSNTYELSPGALTELRSLSSVGFFGRRVKGQLPREKLKQAGFIGDRSRPTELDETVLNMFNHGCHWILESARPVENSRSMEGWGVDKAIFIFTDLSVNESNNGEGIFGYCSTNDLARILLMWSGTQPSWQISFTLPEISLKEMMGRLINHPSPSHVDGDATAFSTEPWRQFSFTDATGDNGIAWITTPSRGSALCNRGLQRDGLIISSPANQPLWVYLSMVVTIINFGETSEV